MIDLSTLNDMQQKAVLKTEGSVLILAGAGSGKTTVLVNRIAYIIETKNVRPYNIMAITFTNKAAGEMRERVDQIVGFGSEQIWVSTFHSACVRILRRFADHLGYDRNFVIYDTDDQKHVIKDICKRLNIDTKIHKERSLLSAISSAKNEMIDAKSYILNAAGDYSKKRIGDVYAEYEKVLYKNNAMDFDDLLVKTVELLRANEDVLNYYQERFKYIMVDEYQDTNTVQFRLVSLLAGKYRNLCVVGDDDQSIYKFRGANIYNILNFEKEFPDAKVIKLEQNYRSTGNILEASQKIINENKTRKEKEFFTVEGKGEPVEIESLRDETEEANYVALSILKLQKEYPEFGDFAVLYRTNAQSYNFEKAFMGMHIPYKIVGGVRFYDRKEVKDVLAILKLIQNQRDTVSLARVVSNVLSGIGEVSLGKLLTAMDAMEGVEPLFDADLVEVLSTTKAKNALRKLTGFLRKMQNATNVAKGSLGGKNGANVAKNTSENVNETNVSFNPGEVVKRIVEYFDFKALTDDGTPAAEERMRNLEVLGAQAAEYDSLEEFLADATLMSSADETTVGDAVTLMTLHAAKGLEFPVVFVVGLGEGVFPNQRAVFEKTDGLEEERRLCYVAVTRAKKECYLTSNTGYSFVLNGSTQVSRFINEMRNNIDYLNKSKRPSYLNDLNKNTFNNTKKTNKPVVDRVFGEEVVSKNEFRNGTLVEHTAFGEGIVISVEGTNLRIAFKNAQYGVKLISSTFKGLKIK